MKKTKKAKVNLQHDLQKADNKGADQTVQKRSLVCAFVLFRERITMCGGTGWIAPLLIVWTFLENAQFQPFSHGSKLMNSKKGH